MSQRLDETKTAGFTLGPPVGEAPVAVLLLHGFTGSPWEVRPLGESLAARGVHVHCPRLPGHGTTPEAMLFAGKAEWLAAAEAGLEALRGARAVVVAGLSMGALLALLLAARHPARVKGLVLLAPAIRLGARDARLLKRLRFLPVAALAPRWVKKESTDLELDEVRAQSPILPRYPLERVLDLFDLQDEAREALPRVRCPSLVLASVHDHVIDPEAALDLARALPFSRAVRLQRGFHIIPRDTDRALALTEVAHFVDGFR